MKVGIFTDTYKPQINGVVTSIALMEKVLRKHGHEPYIFTISHPEVNPEQDPDYVIRVSSFKFWGNDEHRIGMIYSPFASRKAKNLGIEIIHSHAPFSLGIFGHITAMRLKIPEVHTYHTMLEDYIHYLKMHKFIPEQFAQKYSKIFCNMVDGVIVPTPKVYDKLTAYGVSKPMFVLPTGIDLANFRCHFSVEDRLRMRREYGLSADDKVLIFIGRIAQEKNIEALIEYHQELVKADPTYKLFIVGSGDHLDCLKGIVVERNLRESVIFAGKKDYVELPYFYNMADCFVIASTSETQGLVVVEAMATGLPIVAVNDESFHPMVKDGVNGYLFVSKKDYLNRVRELMNNTELRKDLGRKSLEISDEFSAERFYEELIHIYETVKENY